MIKLDRAFVGKSIEDCSTLPPFKRIVELPIVNLVYFGVRVKSLNIKSNWQSEGSHLKALYKKSALSGLI